MDGVIFEYKNVWLELHKIYNTYEEGIELTKKYLNTNYQKLVDEVIGRLQKDKPESEYKKLINSINYNKGIKELFSWLKKNNYKIAIISSGAKELAERAKKDLGIDYIYTNELVFKNGKVLGTKDIRYWTRRADNKAEILRKLCKQHNIDFKDCIVVVHDSADIKMAKTAGFTIGFYPEDEELKKYCNIIINKKDLAELIPVIEEFEKRQNIYKLLP